MLNQFNGGIIPTVKYEMFDNRIQKYNNCKVIIKNNNIINKNLFNLKKKNEIW